MMQGIKKFAVFFVMWCSTFVLAVWKGGMAAWFLFYSLGVVAAYLLCFLLFTFRSLKVETNVEHFNYLSDDDVLLTVSIHQTSWIPLLWLTVEQEWTNRTRGHTYYYNHLFFPGFRREIFYQYKIPRAKRGEHSLGQVEVCTGDVFGLIAKHKRSDCKLNFIVYPRPLPILPRNLIHQSDSGSIHTSINRQDTSHFSGVRDYVEGDPLNRIDWKATARTHSLKTKELDNFAERQHMIFLDAEQASYLSTQPIPLFEKCVQVAASLLSDVQNNRLSTGLICNNQQVYRLPIVRHSSLHNAYAFLARVCPDGSVPLHEVLLEEMSSMQMNTSVLYVTSNVNESLLSKVQKLRSKRIQVSIMLIYSTVVLSWHQLYLKQQLESLGCTFYAIQQLEMDWSEQGGMEYAGA